MRCNDATQINLEVQQLVIYCRAELGFLRIRLNLQVASCLVEESAQYRMARADGCKYLLDLQRAGLRDQFQRRLVAVVCRVGLVGGKHCLGHRYQG